MGIPESHLAQEAIAALVDGELSGQAAGRAARHLAGCAQCRMAVQAQREAKDALQAGVDLAVPGDLLSRLKAIPFTADVPGSGGLGTLSATADGVTSSGLGGAWAIPLAPPEPPARSDGGARWLRRGMTGALAGLGIGVVALAVSLPSGDLPADEVARSGETSTVRPAGPTERTDVVPPVVRTLTVGAGTTLPSDGTP